MSDSGDDDKSGFSDAFKRAAVKFGIGRYLYRDGVPRFVQETLHHQPSHSGHSHPGSAPDHLAAEPASVSPVGPRPGSEVHGPPQTGKALFAWIKQQDEKHGYGLLRLISGWAKQRDFPARMVQWTPEQVHQAYGEAASAVRDVMTTQHAPDASSSEPADTAAVPAANERTLSAPRKGREAAQPRPARSR
jgi:hypothetical protein